jgi:hypothetical protein
VVEGAERRQDLRVVTRGRQRSIPNSINMPRAGASSPTFLDMRCLRGSRGRIDRRERCYRRGVPRV